MTSDQAPHALYLLILLVFVGSALIGMRLSAARVAKIALAWIAIFGLFFALFAFRDEFSALWQRLKAEATGAPIESGGELRIPVSGDGHFWVDAKLNGREVRFLIDSGASITAISRDTAAAAGVEPGFRTAIVETANGTVRMKAGRIDRLQIGPIERSDVGVLISPRDRMNLLGMNFLSSLSSWRVEGNYLVLRP